MGNKKADVCQPLEVAGIEPASFCAHRAHLQVCLSFQIVGKGGAEQRASLSVFRDCVPAALRTAWRASPGWLQTFPALKAAHRGVRRSCYLRSESEGAFIVGT